MKPIQKFRRFFSRMLRRQPASLSPRHDYWAKQFTELILREGRNLSDENLEAARNLGLDIEMITAEHDRREAASWRVDFNLELENLIEEKAYLADKLNCADIPNREIATNGKLLTVDLCGLYKRIDLPDRTISTTEVIELGVKAIHERLAEAPSEFPPNQYPHGADDWELRSLGWNEAEQYFYLTGGWKPEVRNRVPSKLNPEVSIDLRRAPPTTKKLESTKPIPDLEKIFLNVWLWPNQKHVVMNLFASEEGCPVPQKSPHPEQPDTLRLEYPSEDLPLLGWKTDWLVPHNPAMDFLFRRRCQALGKSSNWLDPWTREVLFENYESTSPVTDLRASLRSGPTGPAPLIKGMQWPCCPGCGKSALFSQSVDVRDIGFADLLPGTTMVIFACNDCLEEGHWQNCSVVFWLGRDDEIVLLDQGNAAPLIQSSQWYAAELIDAGDLPLEIKTELESFQNLSDEPCYPLPQSFGTKVGGFPAYLQQEQVFYDRNGVVMEYLAQIATPEHISSEGFGYLSFSTVTGETYIDFQST